MGIKRSLLFVAFGLFLLNGQAMAHVAIPERNSNGSVILHVAPDDDPIAGQESTLFFSVKDSSLVGDSNVYVVTITNESSDSTNAPAVGDGQTISAVYTFPKTGLYFVTLNISSRSPTSNSAEVDYVFEKSVRVTRGAGASKPAADSLAQAVVVSSIMLFVILGIFAYRNRRTIVDHPEF